MYDFNELNRIMNEFIKKNEGANHNFERFMKDVEKQEVNQFAEQIGMGPTPESWWFECPCDLCEIRKWNDTYDFIANFKVKGE